MTLLVNGEQTTLIDFVGANWFDSDVIKPSYKEMKSVCELKVGEVFHIGVSEVKRIA